MRFSKWMGVLGAILFACSSQDTPADGGSGAGSAGPNARRYANTALTSSALRRSRKDGICLPLPSRMLADNCASVRPRRPSSW